MSYSNTTNLSLPVPDGADTHITSYTDRLELAQQLSSSLSKIDEAVTNMGGVTILKLETGAVDQGVGGVIGSAFNNSANRSISQVTCWAENSGSGGVTRVDVQFGLVNFASIFSNNIYKPAVSSSLGNFGRATSTTFVSGSTQIWPANTTLKAILDTVAGGPLSGSSAQKGLVAQVIWKMA